MERRQVVLGVSADFHDSAASLVIDGEVIAAAAEERFSRIKHDPALPERAIEWCLDFGGLHPGDLDYVAYFEKPMTAYERLLVTSSSRGLRSLPHLVRAIPSWSGKRLRISERLDTTLRTAGFGDVPIRYAEHHESHAAGAFFPSPFDRAAVLTFDGVGEWATTTVGMGEGDRIELLSEQRYPDSLGLLYSTITAHCGFDVNDGEQKIMALAPFGSPRFAAELRQVVDVADDGSIRLDRRYFGFDSGRRMGTRRLDTILEGPPRNPNHPVGQREADLARSMQDLLEEVVLLMAHTASARTGAEAVCLSGGVALNCSAVGMLMERGPFRDVWVPPSPGDSGSAIGAALWLTHQVLGRTRVPHPRAEAMSGSFLGPAYDRSEVRSFLDENAIGYEDLGEPPLVADRVASLLASGQLIGWFVGRMEFGPRALGHRSILADPRDRRTADRINDRVKRRDRFQPFAPAVLEERAAEWFVTDRPLPYMSATVPLQPSRRTDLHDAAVSLDHATDVVRSDVPACTHVDLTARVQTVAAGDNPEFHGVLRAFERLTGCPVLLNTSFNGRGEPIVRTPADALRCFRSIGLDAVVIEGFLIESVGAR